MGGVIVGSNGFTAQLVRLTSACEWVLVSETHFGGIRTTGQTATLFSACHAPKVVAQRDHCVHLRSSHPCLRHSHVRNDLVMACHGSTQTIHGVATYEAQRRDPYLSNIFL